MTQIKENHTQSSAKERAPRSRAPAPAYWLITKRVNGRIEVLTLHCKKVLPVFSHKEEAQMFLRLSKDVETAGWWIKKATAGELVSLLLAPCAKVKRVALDPLPTTSLGRVIVPLFCVGRERFAEELLEVGKHEGAVEPLVPA